MPTYAGAVNDCVVNGDDINGLCTGAVAFAIFGYGFDASAFATEYVHYNPDGGCAHEAIVPFENRTSSLACTADKVVPC